MKKLFLLLVVFVGCEANDQPDPVPHPGTEATEASSEAPAETVPEEPAE